MPGTAPSFSPVSSSSALPAGDNGSGSFSNGRPQRSLGFLEILMKRKESFIQLFVMTGILLLSLRSLGQKHRMHELSDVNSNLREERESLSFRVGSIKSALLREAALDPSGVLSSHLRRLFQMSSSSDH
ncbi:hypothetical protein KSP40_PGU001191 [Platanthera guangdongensis]|uniref:Uncharacterized protein n=1 Tax=Platanthera guangdongensis TaxID=2320717 RepID=A0ABR2MEA7_9ASPA